MKIKNDSSYYRGWNITYNMSRPVTGVFKAERFGVTLSAGDRQSLEKMIDVRIRECPKSGGA